LNLNYLNNTSFAISLGQQNLSDDDSDELVDRRSGQGDDNDTNDSSAMEEDVIRRPTLQERFLPTYLDPQAKGHLKTMTLFCPKKTKFQVLLSLKFPAETTYEILREQKKKICTK